MTPQPIYPRTYEYGPLKKAMQALLYLGTSGLGVAEIALSRGLVPAPARLETFVGLFVLLALSYSALYFCLVPRVSLWTRGTFVLAVCGLWYAVIDLGAVFIQFPKGFWAIQAASLMLCGACLYFLAGALRGRLILHAGLLDIRGALSSRSVRYADILDVSRPSITSDQHLVTLKLRDGKSLAIGVFGHADSTFVHWLDSLPDSKRDGWAHQWRTWRANPVYPRIYLQGRVAKTVLSLLSLLVCGCGVAFVLVGLDLAPEIDRPWTLVAVGLLPLSFVVMAEPRWGVVTKTILVLADWRIFVAHMTAYTAPLGPKGAPPPNFPWIESAVGAVFFVQGLVFLVTTLRSRLVLHADRIDYRSFLTTRTVRDADIARTFDYWNSPFSSVGLELKTGRPVRIVNVGRFDPAFSDWLNSSPNKEIDDKARARQQLLANSDLGTNPTERMNAFRRDVRRLNVWSWIGRIAAVWGWILPYPYSICISVLIGLPIVAVLMVLGARSRWSMHTDNGSYPLGIGAELAMAPCLVLALRAFVDDHVFDWIVPAMYGVGAALGLMGLVCLIERRFRWQALATGFLVYVCYAWGGLMTFNVMLDTGPRKAVPVKVLKFERGDKYSSLTVSRPDEGPHGKSIDIPFPRHTARAGDTVCLIVHQGALGWSWYYDSPCPKDNK